LSYNAITSIRQPDFNDQFPELFILYCGSNLIHSIEHGYFRGTHLNNINFYNNRLTAFPDFSEVTDTLKIISLVHNKICHVPGYAVRDLRVLQNLNLEHNPLVRITEELFNLTSLTWFVLSNTSPLCCRDMAWLKDMEIQFDAVKFWTSQASCSAGTTLENHLWDDVTEDQLMDEECPEPGSTFDPCGEFSGQVKMCEMKYAKYIDLKILLYYQVSMTW
jgi:hypothetical protein